MKLNELMRLISRITDCIDICDDTMETLYVAYCYSEDDDMDDFIKYFGDNVEVAKVGKDLVCVKAYEFVKEHYEAFKKFTIEENDEAYKMTYEDEDDNIEVALETLNSLICGNYSDSDYKKLLKYCQE